MKVKTLILAIIIVCAGAMASAGTVTGNAVDQTGPDEKPSAVLSAAADPPASTPTADALTAKPTLSPASTPGSTPAPTPAPDPWAGRFSSAGPYLSVRDPDRGPWIYKDETLSITVTIPHTGRQKNLYCKADIYTRGTLPVGGFANLDAKGHNTALPYRIARQYHAVLAITGDYISCSYNKKGVMIRNGVVYYDKGDAPTLAFLPSGEMKIYDPGKITAKQLLALGVQDSFSFGPVLVNNGRIPSDVARDKLNYHSFRAAIGQVEPGHYIIIVTRSAILLTDLAQLFIDAGCKSAYNMDGGYSAAMVFMGEQINKNIGDRQLQRSLPDLMMIGSSKTVPGEKAPVYGNGVSLNKRFKPKPTEGLIK